MKYCIQIPCLKFYIFFKTRHNLSQMLIAGQKDHPQGQSAWIKSESLAESFSSLVRVMPSDS